MNPQIDSIAWLSTALMFALVGAGVMQTSPRNAGRPPSTEPLGQSPLYSQQIAARLWEDPLEAAKRAENKTTNADSINLQKWQQAGDAFKEQTEMDGKKADPDQKRTLLLPIVVPEQMYPEIREQRLRTRYAVVSALAAADFHPESADELNIVPVPVCTRLGESKSGLIVPPPEGGTDVSWIPVPYEIFRRSEEPAQAPGSRAAKAKLAPRKSQYLQVVVFWIDARITSKPSLFRTNIDILLAMLSPDGKRNVHFVSTQGSGTLTDILATKEALGNNANEIFYFPLATVPKEWLRTRVRERTVDAFSTAGNEPIVSMRPVKRVQASDDYVIEMLLDELSLRVPGFGKGENEVCLLYETDSFYGRTMVDVFNSRYRDFTGKEQARAETISYLKGVDGTLPLVQQKSESPLNPQDTTALLSAINKRVMERNSEQWVLDQRQTDYLERQAHSLKSRVDTIRAIGVFGTNVFDKIKVIEILRKEFKNVWFFTVDLDASFINNDNPLATRNVLIGSALDCSVTDGRVTSPEFRDSFQSALFLSTLDALGVLDKNYVGKPSVWETSRAGFERLTFSGQPIWHVDSMCNEQACGNGSEKGQAWSWDMFLERHFQVKDGRKVAKFLRPILLILTAVFLVAVAKVIVEAWRSPDKPRWHGQIVNQLERTLPTGSYKRVVAGMFIAVAALCLFGWLAQKVLGGLSEPFHWFNGDSIWPSLIIRGFAAVLGFYFFMRSFIDIDEAIHKMWNVKESGALLRGLEAAKFAGRNVESRYYFRVLILVASFVLLQWSLFQVLGVAGRFFTPGRGSMAFFSHEMTILFSQAVFYLLVWSAVLRHLRCRELLSQLTAQTDPPADGEPMENSAQTSLPEGALSKPEILTLLKYNQAVVQSILYPFAMLVVLLASRHPVFDAWNFPVALLISSSLILGVLVFCAYLLNESANELAKRQKALFKPASDARTSSEAIWESKELIGSFIPFWKQPVIQALTLAAAGLGLQWIQ